MSEVGEVIVASGGLIYAFDQSNIAGKLIIALLAIVSVFSWSVMVVKFLFIREAQKENVRFLARFRKSRHPLEMFQKKMDFSPSPVAEIYEAGAREVCFHAMGSDEVDETFSARLEKAEDLHPSAMSSVRSRMDQLVGEQMLKLESQLVLLATAVSGAPFLGLLGTVWGVMDAFSGVAQAGNSSLAALAPGVSGSLITTVTALLVAIPAMFGYNFLITTIRSMTVQMENFAAECASDFEHEFLQLDP